MLFQRSPARVRESVLPTLNERSQHQPSFIPFQRYPSKSHQHVMSFNGKVIAITGAGQGIGLATARLLAERGASVSLADTNSTTLADVEQDFKAKGYAVLVTTVDVSKRAQVDDWIANTVQKFGRLDGAGKQNRVWKTYRTCLACLPQLCHV